MSKPEKILLIVGNGAFGDQLSDALKKDGYEAVTVVKNGVEGLKMIYDTLPHLVVLDVALSDADSYDIVAKKQAEPMLAKIPLFLMSNQGVPINMRRIPAGAVSEFIASLRADAAEVVAKVNHQFKHEVDPGLVVPQAPAGDHKKVVWVEDDKLIGSILAKKLSSSGFDLFHAKNGEEAMTALKTIVPDVIALDLMLPGMSGFDILTAARQDERLKSVPVIILSNLSKQSDIERAKSLGAQKFLVKAAVSLDQIVEEIKGMCK